MSLYGNDEPSEPMDQVYLPWDDEEDDDPWAPFQLDDEYDDEPVEVDDTAIIAGPPSLLVIGEPTGQAWGGDPGPHYYEHYFDAFDRRRAQPETPDQE